MATAASQSSTRHVRALTSLVPFTLLAVVVAAVFLQWTPHGLHSFLRYDSGIFLYVAEQLRHGETLYRDVWDHKPPLIFYFNELGLAAASGSPAGVLILEYTFVLSFFLLAFREAARLADRGIALFSTCIGVLLFLDVALHPNLGEVISLPLQAISFALLARDIESGVSLGRASVQGILLSALFWMRPNGIAISIVYCTCAILLMAREGLSVPILRWAAVFSCSAAASSLALIASTLRASSWNELWFATFTFNQLYAGLTTFADRAHALIWMIIFAGQHGVILLALAGILSILLSRPGFRTRPDLLRAMTVLWLALEMISSAYTGKLYGKNVIPWILPCILSVTFLFEEFRPDHDFKMARPGRFGSFTALIAAFIMLTAFTQYRQAAKEPDDTDTLLLSKINELAKPADQVIFWGSFPMDTIYLAHRQSASRFFSSVPLMHGEPAYRRLAPLELTDILRNEPKLIVERNDGQIPALIQSPAEGGPHMDWDTPALREQKSRLVARYEAAWVDSKNQITIYRRR